MCIYPPAFESPFPGALQRFVDKHEQEKDGSGDALRQILEGKKKGCWIWWILPQVAGEVLHHTGGKHDGSSESRRFALEGLREAIAFLDHSFLGKNYFACVRAIRDQVEPSGPRGGQGRTLNEIFGESDAKKVRCSVTLFRRAACWSSQLSHNSYRELVANCDAILVAASRDGHHPCEHVPKVCSAAERSQEFLDAQKTRWPIKPPWTEGWPAGLSYPSGEDDDDIRDTGKFLALQPAGSPHRSHQDRPRILLPEDDESIEDLGLNPTLVRLLKRNGIRGVAELAARTDGELMAIQNLGPVKLEKIRNQLKFSGRRLRDDAFAEGRDRLRSAKEAASAERKAEAEHAQDLVGPLVSLRHSVDEIVESTGLSERVVRDARNLWMINEWVAGASNNQIGEKVGMSAEAVRRSIKRACKRDGEPVQNRRARRKADTAKEFKESIRGIVTENPGFSLDEIAQIAGVRPVEVRRNLTRLGTKLVLGLGTGAKPKTWSDERLLQALRIASTKSTPLTTASYNALVRQNQIEGPTAQIMYKRFGSWREACKAAGVRCGEVRHDNYTSKWSKSDLEKLVVDFLFSPEHGGMFRDFENWLGRRDDPPSVPTFRSRLGHWDSMKQTAIETIIDTGRIDELRDLYQ